ncbi:hypothetical protein GF324_07665 [bacterium]|nr:hypothetical protein [bacterium]
MSGDEPIPQLAPVGVAVVAVYFAALWGIALFGRGRDSGGDFFLAGRRLTLPAFIATLVTTWYGGILGVGEHAWLYGITTWLVFGGTYYLHAILFAFFIAPKAREGRFINLPDHLEKHYGRTAAVIGAGILLLLVIPAPYVLMLGTLLQSMFPIGLGTALVLGAVLSTLYLWRGGFSTVVRTDVLQFVLMFLGFILILGFAIGRLAPADMPKALPATHLDLFGGQPWSYFGLWLIIAAQTYIEPSIHQRCYAAATPSTARRGMLGSVGFWVLFDFLTVSTGLYARALIPDLANPVAAFPALAVEVLPPLLAGLAFAGLFATVMSTVDSYGFLAAITLGRDLFGRLRGTMEDEVTQRWVRISLLIVAAVSVLLAWTYQTAVGLWIALGSIATPALLIPVLAGFWKRRRMERRFAIASMLLAGTGSFGWTLAAQWTHAQGGFLGVEAVFVGLGLSVLTYIAGLIHAGRSR